MSGMPERGKRGWAPWAISRAARVMRVSGWAIERPATVASAMAMARATSAAPKMDRCAPPTMASTWSSEAATRTAPKLAGMATYISGRPRVTLVRRAEPL